MKIINLLKGVIFVYFWYFSIFFGFATLYCPFIPLLIYSHYVFRSYTDKVFAFWELYPTALVQLLFGTKIRVYGDYVDPEEMSLMVMNHRTRMDWFYFWLCMFHAKRNPHQILTNSSDYINELTENETNLNETEIVNGNPNSFMSFLHRVFNQKGRLKYILKDEIRHIPGAGWVMQMNCFTYIKRNWEHDEPEIIKIIKYLKKLDYTYQLLIFPEGTDLTEKSVEKSNLYAEKNNLMPFYQVLHPRTRGFSVSVRHLFPKLQAVYDFTIAYSNFNSSNGLGSYGLKDLLYGNFPKEVHFTIKKYPVEVLPQTLTELGDWLNERWKEKEVQLENFYQNGHFSKDYKCINHDGKKELIIGFLMWTGLVLLYPFMIYQVPSFAWVLLGHMLLFLKLSLSSYGFQDMEITHFNYRNKST